MAINRLIIAGNALFFIAIACYFTASEPLAFAIGAAGIALEGFGLAQLIKARKDSSDH